MTRARLLEAFLPLLPPNVTTHFSTRVTGVQNVHKESDKPSSHVRVSVAHLGNESAAPEYFDVAMALGCDGIRSIVRLQDMPFEPYFCLQFGQVRESFPREIGGMIRYSGTYAYRGLLDLDKAIAKVGDFAQGPTNWVGKDRVCSPRPAWYIPHPLHFP